jgi:hypothetical protein
MVWDGGPSQPGHLLLRGLVRIGVQVRDCGELSGRCGQHQRRLSSGLGGMTRRMTTSGWCRGYLQGFGRGRGGASEFLARRVWLEVATRWRLRRAAAVPPR